MKRRNSTYNIALTGLMMALSLALLYIGSVLPALESTFYIFSGIATGIVVTQAGFKNGILLYIGTTILGLLIVPDKGSAVLFGLLFGLYGIVKFLIERLPGKFQQLCLKLAFILADSVILWTLFRGLLLGETEMPNYMKVLALITVVVTFFIYDYVFTLALYIFRRKFRHENVNFNLSGSIDEKDATNDNIRPRHVKLEENFQNSNFDEIKLSKDETSDKKEN